MTRRTLETRLKRILRFVYRRSENQILVMVSRWKRMVRIAGVELGLPANLSLRLRTVLANGNYEKEELSILQATLADNDVVLEFGTGMGLLAIFCAKKVGSNNVTTYEANPEMEEVIRDNFRRNNVSPKLHLAAIGKVPGTTSFSITPDFWASSTVGLENWKDVPAHAHTGVREVKIAVESVEKVMRSVSPTYLICDTEGGEFEISQAWDLSTVNKLLIELHPAVIGEEKVKSVVRSIESFGLMLDRNLSHTNEMYFTRSA